MTEPMDLGTGMAIVADAIDAVGDAAEAVFVEAKPRDQSPGMTDISRERPFCATPGATPVVDTFAYASLLGYAAIDALRAMAIQFRAPKMTVWQPLVNARTGVEAAALVHWLMEPGIATEARVQRGMVMRLRNARQQQNAPKELVAAHKGAQAAIDSLATQAQALGWTISGKKQRCARVGTETEPTTRIAIDSVLRHRCPDHDTEADLTWWFHSGVVRANPFAFMQFADPAQGVPTGIDGLTQVPIYIDGPMNVTAAATAGRAVTNAAHAHGFVLGLEITELEKAEQRFAETVVGTMKAMDRSGGIPRSELQRPRWPPVSASPTE
jgi:hypothetical protein